MRAKEYPYVVLLKNEFYGKRGKAVQKNNLENLLLGDKFKMALQMEEGGEIHVFPRGFIKNDSVGKFLDLKPLLEGSQLKKKMVEFLKDGPLSMQDFFAKAALISVNRKVSEKALRELKSQGVVKFKKGILSL